MKLSEKLAVLEEEERKATAKADPGHTRSAPRRPAPRPRPAAPSSWEESKRKVRDLVLAEVAPKMGKLKGEAP